MNWSNNPNPFQQIVIIPWRNFIIFMVWGKTPLIFSVFPISVFFFIIFANLWLFWYSDTCGYFGFLCFFRLCLLQCWLEYKKRGTSWFYRRSLSLQIVRCKVTKWTSWFCRKSGLNTPSCDWSRCLLIHPIHAYSCLSHSW